MKTNANQNFYITCFGKDIDSFNLGQSLLYSNDPRECYYVILKVERGKRLFFQAKDDEWYGGILFGIEREIPEDTLLRMISHLYLRWQRGELNLVKSDLFRQYFSQRFFVEGGIISPLDYVS